MYNDYREILLLSFKRRQDLNSQYTLRSFARDIQLAPSTLSEIFKGKKGLSVAKAEKLAKRLNFPDWLRSQFRLLVAASHARSPVARSAAKLEIKKNRPLFKMESVRQMAQDALCSWRDLAVLECVHLKNFNHSEEWIAERIGCTTSEVKEIRKRLIKVQLLQVKSNGEWEDRSPFFTTTDGIAAESLQRFHNSILDLAKEKLQNTDVSQRTMKSVVFSLSRHQLNEAKGIIDEAVSKIVALAGSDGVKNDHVMAFSSQLLFLTNINEEK